MKYKWNVLPEAGDEALVLVRELGISPLLARLLIHRGISDPDSARAFLEPRLQDLHDPYRMKDMDRATERVFEAIRRQEKILVYGDYDVDGITSTVVLKRALEMLGACADFYLPRRLEEGYGIKSEVLKRAYQEGFRLVITADSGIRAHEECRVARALGLDIIVTDHHLPDAVLPPACAILNPRRPDCAYPDKQLAAAGVAFKLVQALFHKAGKEKVVEHFLKLVAIGTVGDIVPVTGENRLFVRFGLQGLAEPRNLGLKALLAGAGVEGEVSLFDVGFKLAPRINAVTRMGGGREVVDLFSVDDYALAEGIVREMNEKNQRRQQQERRILAEIEERFQKDPTAFQKKFLLLAGQGWHRGVIGIVASRLMERFYRPALVLSVDEPYCQGSGRSIPDFHLLEAFDRCRDLFVQYGGHAQAAGCTVRAQDMDELRARLQDYAEARLSTEQLTPSLGIDSFLPIHGVSLALYREVERLAPFGAGNPVPIFASERVDVVGGPWVLKGEHLKFQVQTNGCRTDAIWWKKGEMADVIASGRRWDLAYTMTRDVYQGEEKLLLTLRDAR